MGKCIILYESRYGCTKKYADWLCERLPCDKARLKGWDPSRLEGYDTVILAGSVFVSGILGIHFLHRHYDSLKGKKLAVLIVGASPQDPQATQALAEKNLLDKARDIPCFYVRGAWRSKDRSLLDRALFRLQLKTLEKDKNEHMTGCDGALLSCRQTEGDWSGPEQLDDLLGFIKDESAWVTKDTFSGELIQARDIIKNIY